MSNLFLIRTKVERERRKRIILSVWAYAYEFENCSIVSDHVFDAEALKVDRSISTGRPVMDFFFATAFDPCTGVWIHRHPELDGIKRIYRENFA